MNKLRDALIAIKNHIEKCQYIDEHIVSIIDDALADSDARDLRIVEATLAAAAHRAELSSCAVHAWNAVLSIDKAQIFRDMEKK